MKVLDVYIQHSKNSLNRPFSYLCDDKTHVGVGFRVLVTFNGQKIVGYVSAVRETNQTKAEFDEANGFQTSFATSVLDKEPLLNGELMSLADEITEYYLSPKISVLQAMLPSSLRPASSALNGPKIAYEKWVELLSNDEEGLTPKQTELLRMIAENSPVLKRDCGSPTVLEGLLKKNRVRIILKEKERFHVPEYEKEQAHELTINQQKAYEYIVDCPKDTILLQGVTGSGKTEIYLKLAEESLGQGKNVLMMVPEISLTPRMVEYFARRFGSTIAILHSELTPAEKYDEYRRIARGEAKIVVGARSAVFAPLDNIGLIILDEEHVESYKQDTAPYYHAKDVAIMRAKHFGAKVVLGSATPSLETKARASRGVYGYVELNKRINERPLPKTTIVDLTKPGAIRRGTHLFSAVLADKIKEKLEKKEQIMLLMNKRGYSSYVTCSSCGYIYECPNCHGHLTYHRHDEMLKCHRCDFVMHYPETCPNCGSEKIMRVGFGTERIVKELGEQFPDAKVARLDSDVGKVRNNIAKVLGEFKNHEYDILVGTQMIAKGHDFPNVTLVGVVLADIGLALPTYRASERTFELIAQVVGRAGRAEKEGEAIIQTYNPSNYAITLGAKQDYESFYNKEMQNRRIAKYPPYVYLVVLTFSGKNEERVIDCAYNVKDDIHRQNFESVDAVGPISPFAYFVDGYHKRTLLIKYRNPSEIVPYLRKTIATLSGKAGIDISADVDPLDY